MKKSFYSFSIFYLFSIFTSTGHLSLSLSRLHDLDHRDSTSMNFQWTNSLHTIRVHRIKIYQSYYFLFR